MRLGGIIIYLLFLPLAPLAYVLLPLMILWNPARAKESMRAVDQFCNAFYTNGIGRESTSSHAWRDRERPWARLVMVTSPAAPPQISSSNCVALSSAARVAAKSTPRSNR